MSWRGVVWREHGAYGPAGGFEARKKLGTFRFPFQPEPGTTIDIDQATYDVVEQHPGWVVVRPHHLKGTPA